MISVLLDTYTITSMPGDGVGNEVTDTARLVLGAAMCMWHVKKPREYDGQDKVNPMAMLLRVKLMFDWLGENEAAQRQENAVASVTGNGTVGTYDVGLSSTMCGSRWSIPARRAQRRRIPASWTGSAPTPSTRRFSTP